jgi:hypothetical protein
MVIPLVTKTVVVATVTVWADGREDIWEDTAEEFEDTVEMELEDTAEEFEDTVEMELEDTAEEETLVETGPYRTMIWPAIGNADRFDVGLLTSNPAAHAKRKSKRTRTLAVLAPFLSTSFLDMWQGHEHLTVV